MVTIQSGEIENALQTGAPVVAIESAVLSHGLPSPQNIEIVSRMQQTVRQTGAVPAVVGVIRGALTIGLTERDIEFLGGGERESTLKITERDLAFAAATSSSGGTTVAATLTACRLSGISTFVTGGIGGVHRLWQETFDVSVDLDKLAHTPCCVVCSGPKSILDVRATVESLETHGIPIFGYQTDCMPQFYSRGADCIPVRHRVDDTATIASICRHHWTELGLESAVIVANPCPEGDAISQDLMDSIIDEAVHEARSLGVHGFALTPFLLEYVARESDGRSLRANLALLESNARLAGEIAVAMTR